MSPWWILAAALYLAAEWVCATWLASSVGWGGVLLVVLVLVVVGTAVMRRAGFAAARSLRPVTYDGATVVPGATPETLGRVGRDVGDAGSLFVAGVLIALPGLVTSAVGLLLLVPPVRRWASGLTVRTVRRRAARAGFVAGTATVRGDVVQGDVVADGTGPADGPRPPRGEIVQGEVVDRPEDGPAPPSSP